MCEGNNTVPNVESMVRNMSSEERITLALPHSIGVCNFFISHFQLFEEGACIRECYEPVFFNTGELNCYSISPNWNGKTANRFEGLHKAGIVYKNPTELKLFPDETDGLKLFIHPREVMPSSRLTPMSFEAKKYCTYHLTKIIINRLKAPYTTNCSDYSVRNPQNNETVTPLNQENCYSTCLWDESMKHCGCIVDRLGFLKGFKLCTGDKHDKCMQNFNINEAERHCDVRCPAACVSEYYETTGACVSSILGFKSKLLRCSTVS